MLYINVILYVTQHITADTLFPEMCFCYLEFYLNDALFFINGILEAINTSTQCIIVF